MRPASLLALAALGLLAAQLAWGRDLYRALGVKRTASQREIKRAWRRLALLLHPDKIGPDATEKQKERFADASSAYEVLSDPDRRRVYDDTGDTGPSSAAASGQDRDYTANGGVEMFVHFPRGGFRFRRFVPENPKAEPIVVNVLLTLEQLLEPTQHLFHVKRRVMCPHCLGTGADGMDNIKQCTTCGGTGRQVHLGHGPGEYRQATRIKCPVCSGTGTVVAKPCKVCHGHHTVETSAELNFTVPAGALDGQAVVLQQQGHQAWLHAHGDGVLVVRRAPHKVFQSEEANLKMEVAVSLLDALLGFNRTIQLLNGTSHTLVRQTITMSGTQVTVPGAGLPKAGPGSNPFGSMVKLEQPKGPVPMGDLVVVFRVLFPQSVTPAQGRALAAALGESHAHLVRRIVEMTRAAEASAAGEAMQEEETFHSDHCLAEDPWLCPSQPLTAMRWVFSNSRCSRLKPGLAEVEVWGPHCAPELFEDHYGVPGAARESGQRDGDEAQETQQAAGANSSDVGAD